MNGAERADKYLAVSHVASLVNLDDCVDESGALVVSDEADYLAFRQEGHISLAGVSCAPEVAEATLLATPSHPVLDHVFDTNCLDGFAGRCPLLRAQDGGDLFHNVASSRYGSECLESNRVVFQASDGPMKFKLPIGNVPQADGLPVDSGEELMPAKPDRPCFLQSAVDAVLELPSVCPGKGQALYFGPA